MGWFGTALVGAMIGLAGWRLHPTRGGLPAWLTAGLGALAAVAIKFAGDSAAILTDGGTVEWLASVIAAIVAVTAAGFVTRAPRTPRTR